MGSLSRVVALFQRRLASGRNNPYARSLVVTDNRNPQWLGNENHCGRQGVWACSGCATRHHRGICCRLDAASGAPHHNILVQLYLVYDLGGGRIAAACAFLCEAPSCKAAARDRSPGPLKPNDCTQYAVCRAMQMQKDPAESRNFGGS